MLNKERLRYIRKMRGLTQMELGKKCGFKKTSADVRIAQYEGGKRNPSNKVIILLSQALDDKPNALMNPDYTSHNSTLHALFLLEDIYNIPLHKNKDGEITMTFTNDMPIYAGLDDWHFAQDGVRQKAFSIEEYNEFKYNYCLIE